MPATIVPDSDALHVGSRTATPIGAFADYEARSLAGDDVLVRARQIVNPEDPHLAAHFPSTTVYPGVFVLESVFQAAASALGDPASWRIARLKSMRFLSPILAEDSLAIEATVTAGPRAGRHRVGAVCRRADGCDAAQIVLEIGEAAGLEGEAESAGGGGHDAGLDAPKLEARLDPPEIRALLPHGHPMLLVDRVLELDPGRSAVGLKEVTLSDSCYRWLERDVPAGSYAYPTSLLLESFGQTAALVWLAGAGQRAFDSDRVLMLTVARDCEVEGQALPGDSVQHLVRVEHVVGENVFVAGESFVGARRIMRVGSMMAVLRPRDTVVRRRPAGAGNDNGKPIERSRHE